MLHDSPSPSDHPYFIFNIWNGSSMMQNWFIKRMISTYPSRLIIVQNCRLITSLILIHWAKKLPFAYMAAERVIPPLQLILATHDVVTYFELKQIPYLDLTRGKTNYQEEPRLTKQRAQLAFDQVCKFTICEQPSDVSLPLAYNLN